jgi:hypothetical protein
MDLAVRQARVIIDHADDLDLAGVASLVLLAAAHRPVSGPIKLRQLERVDVQQRAGLRPLVAPAAVRTPGPPAP